MDKEEVLARLADWGIIIKSPNTLRNWEKWGLIPEATFRNSRRVEYPDQTPAEGFASVHLLRKYRANNKIAREARKLALEQSVNLEASCGGYLKALSAIWLSHKNSVAGGVEDG